MSGTDVINGLEQFNIDDRPPTPRVSGEVDLLKYWPVLEFLTRATELKNEEDILKDNVKIQEPQQDGPMGELLSNFKIPQEMWLREEVSVKDIRIKTNILLEINNMMERDLLSVRIEDMRVDENVLAYYEKVLIAFKFLEINRVGEDENSKENNPREEDEDLESEELTRVSTNQSSNSLRPRSFLNGYMGSMMSHRRSSLKKRDSTSSKSRLPSSATLYEEEEHGPAKSQTATEDDKKKQPLNGLLAKSKLYNRVKKHRELSGSLNSLASSQSNISQNNRNSISTTASNNSARKKSSTIMSPDFSIFRANGTSPGFQSLAALTVNREEVQREKYDYYIQVKRLKLNVQTILSIQDKKSFQQQVKILRFISRYVFRFIAIDVLEMIVKYGQCQACEQFR